MPDEPAPQLVAFDLETTGLSYERDRVVEIGAVRFDGTGRELGRYQRLVNPRMPMPPGARAIHGISDEMLADAPAAADVLPGFLEFLGEPAATTLLAHHASFDAGFLGRELTRAGMARPGHLVLDTLALARAGMPQAPDHRLDTVCRLLGIDTGGAHRALQDCLRVKELYLRLAGGGPGPATVRFPVYDPAEQAPPPSGFDELVRAIECRLSVTIEYAGGTRGELPRTITPRRFVHRGGAVYLRAYCHLDCHEKEFRLDRVRRHQVLAVEPAQGPG